MNYYLDSAALKTGTDFPQTNFFCNTKVLDKEGKKEEGKSPGHDMRDCPEGTNSASPNKGSLPASPNKGSQHPKKPVSNSPRFREGLQAQLPTQLSWQLCALVELQERTMT